MGVNFTHKIKNIPTLYITIKDKEYDLFIMIRAIEDMLDTNEDDHYGEYSYRDYELNSPIAYYECLVKLGLVKNYVGSREANLFCMAKNATKKLEAFEKDLYACWKSEIEKGNLNDTYRI